jgi:hypothetical protein
VSLDEQSHDGKCNQVPVSIADLGGTEIDLRFSSPQEGNISVVVAPVLRFSSSKNSSPTSREAGFTVSNFFQTLDGVSL